MARSKTKKRKILEKPKSRRRTIVTTMGRWLSWAFLLVFVLTSVVVLVTPNRVKEVREAEKVYLKEKATPKEIGLFYIRNDNYAEALKYLKKAVETSPDDPELLRYLIESAEKTGDYHTVEAYLPKYIAFIDSKVKEVREEVERLRAELYDKAEDSSLKEKLSLAEGRLASYLSTLLEMKVLYAYTLAVNGKLDKALQIAKELKTAFPKNKKLKNLEERLVLISGDPKAIIKFLEKKPREKLTRSEYYLLGTAYLSLDEYAKARKVFREALKRYTDRNKVFLLGLLQTYRSEGKYQEVLNLLKSRVGYTEDPELLYYYGEALYKLGKKEEAETYFSEAIKKAKDEIQRKQIELLVNSLKNSGEEKASKGESES